MKKVDARGLSCPEPVIRAKNAMESGDKEYEILVDNVVAKENVSRFATHQGYHILCLRIPLHSLHGSLVPDRINLLHLLSSFVSLSF